MIPAFLVSKMAGPIASGAAVMLLGALIYVSLTSRATIASLRNSIDNPKTGYVVRLEAAQADAVQCRSNRITLEESTARQNAAVEAAQAQAARRESELQAAADDYRKRLERTNALVASIMAVPATGDACKDAEHLIRQVVK